MCKKVLNAPKDSVHNEDTKKNRSIPKRTQESSQILLTLFNYIDIDAKNW